MADDTKQKCAHPICQCLVGEGAEYCSPYCEAAEDTTEISCNCGHPGCELADEEEEKLIA